MQYKDIESQNKQLILILKKNKDLMKILGFLEELNLPNFYIVAGAVFQTIWNYLDKIELNSNIKDIDIVYYDANNLAKDYEQKLENEIVSYLKTIGLNYEIDLHNEARMHLWKKVNENKEIKQYISSEDAISQFIVTTHAIGITKKQGKIKIYAPYGLNDIFSKTVRPIKHKGNDINIYNKKVESWKKRFDNLNIVEW
jgi:uncharacterized protein